MEFCHSEKKVGTLTLFGHASYKFPAIYGIFAEIPEITGSLRDACT